MNTLTIADRPERRKDSTARQHAINNAAAAYHAALFDFADGKILWPELLAKCRGVRAALRRRRHQAAA